MNRSNHYITFTLCDGVLMVCSIDERANERRDKHTNKTRIITDRCFLICLQPVGKPFKYKIIEMSVSNVALNEDKQKLNKKIVKVFPAPYNMLGSRLEIKNHGAKGTDRYVVEC